MLWWWVYLLYPTVFARFRKLITLHEIDISEAPIIISLSESFSVVGHDILSSLKGGKGRTFRVHSYSQSNLEGGNETFTCIPINSKDGLKKILNEKTIPFWIKSGKLCDMGKIDCYPPTKDKKLIGLQKLSITEGIFIEDIQMKVYHDNQLCVNELCRNSKGGGLFPRDPRIKARIGFRGIRRVISVSGNPQSLQNSTCSLLPGIIAGEILGKKPEHLSDGASFVWISDPSDPTNQKIIGRITGLTVILKKKAIHNNGETCGAGTCGTTTCASNLEGSKLNSHSDYESYTFEASYSGEISGIVISKAQEEEGEKVFSKSNSNSNSNSTEESISSLLVSNEEDSNTGVAISSEESISKESISEVEEEEDESPGKVSSSESLTLSSEREESTSSNDYKSSSDSALSSELEPIMGKVLCDHPNFPTMSKRRFEFIEKLLARVSGQMTPSKIVDVILDEVRPKRKRLYRGYIYLKRQRSKESIMEFLKSSIDINNQNDQNNKVKVEMWWSEEEDGGLFPEQSKVSKRSAYQFGPLRRNTKKYRYPLRDYLNRSFIKGLKYKIFGKTDESEKYVTLIADLDEEDFSKLSFPHEGDGHRISSKEWEQYVSKYDVDDRYEMYPVSFRDD